MCLKTPDLHFCKRDTLKSDWSMPRTSWTKTIWVCDDISLLQLFTQSSGANLEKNKWRIYDSLARVNQQVVINEEEKHQFLCIFYFSVFRYEHHTCASSQISSVDKKTFLLTLKSPKVPHERTWIWLLVLLLHGRTSPWISNIKHTNNMESTRLITLIHVNITWTFFISELLNAE